MFQNIATVIVLIICSYVDIRQRKVEKRIDLDEFMRQQCLQAGWLKVELGWQHFLPGLCRGFCFFFSPL